MNNEPALLTISMLVSGKKKDMIKSLESLHYFKDAFPCEIILVDTGCSPEQRTLVDQCADKVIEFTWCNDFAAARNAGLREAKGEWFLYLDDDEWFDEPKEIVNFFLSGEYVNYNSASYAIRNYTNAQGTLYEDSYPTRMVRLEPQTKFTGKIHEGIEPVRFPRKVFNDFVHHYGYVYQDEKQRQEHAKRNIEPLLEIRAENPGNPRWIAQLAQEYFGIREYDKVVECCKQGLEEWNALEDQGPFSPVCVGVVYAFILIALDSLNNYTEEKVWLEKAFADPLCVLPIMEPTLAFYCMAGARLFSQTKEYSKSVEYFRRYLDYAERLRDNRDLIVRGTTSVVSGVFQELIFYGTILMCLGAAIRMEDVTLAEKAFYLLKWNDKRLLHQQKWEFDMLDACCSVAYHPAWSRIMQTLVAREGGMEEMHIIFLKTEIDYQNQGETEKLSHLHRIVADLKYENHYILYTKILWVMEDSEFSEGEKGACAKELFGQLFQKYPEKLLETRKDVWNVGEQLGISMENMFLQINFTIWRRQVQQWAEDTSINSIQQWVVRMKAWMKQPDARYDYFFMKCFAAYLKRYDGTKVAEEEKLGQMERLLWEYTDSTLAYYERIYQTSVFRDRQIVLPDEVQLSLELKALHKYRIEKRDKEAVQQLRRCIGVYPELENVIENYAEILGQSIKRRETETQTAKTELLRVVQTLKQLAGQQMEEGNLSAAEEILQQICQCMPDDEVAEQMLKQLQERIP